MYRPDILGVPAIALAILGTAIVAPAQAQLAPIPGTEIEGPISSITVYPTASQPTVTIPDPNGGPTPVTYTLSGEMRVMDVRILVRNDALIHTPTNGNVTLQQLNGARMPGRTQRGFIGGTAIVTGDSYQGVIYASDVFSDLFEHVVVGEATRVADTDPNDELPGDLTVNNMAMTPSTDRRMPATTPVNGFGFEIEPDDIDVGTLLAVEGYYSPSELKLYYHTLEADAAPPKNAGIREVSIMRAQCRLRDDGVELEVRGGVHDPADGTVRILVQSAPGQPFIQVDTVTAVGDLETTPAQGEYRSRVDVELAACPLRARARFGTATATAEFASR